jgi:hypothetical protein
MTPLTGDLCSMRFSRRMLLLRARICWCSLVFVVLLVAGSCVEAAAPLQSSENPSAKPAPVSPAQQPPAAAANSSSQAPADCTPLQKAVHQKKVITEEDLTKPPKPITLSDLEGEENNPTCDLSCEAELREQMGFGPEREAEFRNQLTLARHEIGDDRIWNSHLQSALQAAGDYCDIQRQKARILGKGLESQYLRDSVSSRFAERERKLISQYRESSGLLTQRIQAVQRFAPFRATIMRYQVSEATNRVCPDYTLP